MITLALVSLFILSAITVMVSLGDSILRGKRAFDQLSKAVQVEEMEYRQLVRASEAPAASVHKSPSVRQKRRAPRSGFSTTSMPLPAAA